MLPAASKARTRTVFGPSLVIGGVEPPVTGRLTYVAPLSSEYSRRVTPTLSLAEIWSVTPGAMNQLLLPVDVDTGATPLTGSPARCAGADGVLATVMVGAVVSGACAPAVGTAIRAAPSAAADATRLNNLLPLRPWFDWPAN